MEDCLAAYEKFGSAKLMARGRVGGGPDPRRVGRRRADRTARARDLAEGRAQGEPKFVHYSLHYLGDCALWRGETAKAVQIYAESLRAALDYGNDMEAATEMQGMAFGLLGCGREEDGFRFYAASCARYEELQSTALDEVAFWVGFRERYLLPARERLGVALAQNSEAEGRSMGWQRALAYAFELGAGK